MKVTVSKILNKTDLAQIPDRIRHLLIMKNGVTLTVDILLSFYGV